MKPSATGTKRRGADAPEPPPPPGRLDRGADTVWRGFADPRRLGWVLGLTALGTLAAGALRLEGPFRWLLSAAAGNAVVERLVRFFDLHRPFASWWFLLLVALSVLTAVATLAELQGSVILRLRRRGRRPLAVPPEAAAREAADVFAKVGKRGEAPGRVVFWRRSLGLETAIGLLGLGGLLLLVGLAVERSEGFAGEVLLRPGEAADVVQVRGPGGEVTTRALGTRLYLAGTSPEGAVRVRLREADGPEVALRPDRPLVVDGVAVRPRALRQAEGGARLSLELVDRDGDERAQVEVGLLEPARLGEATFTVLDLQDDLRGQGRAALVEAEGPDGEGERFWLFARDPDFDLENREGRYGARLLEVTQGREAILAAEHHPGRDWLWAGLIGLLAALALGLASARKGAAVEVADVEAAGAPEDDPLVADVLDRVGAA